MYTIVADAAALTAIVERGQLPLLRERAERIILSTAVVDELVESGTIDALIESAVETIMEVVSLTQEDDALAAELDERLPRASAEAIALMQRPDLAAALLVSAHQAARETARARGLAVESLDSLLGSVESAPPAPPEEEPWQSAETEAWATQLVEVDGETAVMLAALVERGVGSDPAEVVRRAIQGLAFVLDL